MADGKGFANVGHCIAFAAGHPATVDVAGFEALTWTPWEEMTDVSGGGETTTPQSYKPACSGKTYKVASGSERDDLSVNGAYSSVDTAQALFRTIYATSEKLVSVRETLPNGDVIYSYGFLASIGDAGYSAEGVKMLGITVALSDSPVEDLAA